MKEQKRGVPSEIMDIVPISDTYREEVNNIVEVVWNGPLVVTRGKIFDTSNLPGFIALHDGGLAGVIAYRQENGEYEIAYLISLIENMGIGTKLTDRVITEAKDNNIKRVCLITTNDNTHVIRFYQKMGFALKAVHINAVNESRKLKPSIPLTGLDDIPILHEFEFEMIL